MIAPVCPALPSALYTFSPFLSQEGGRLPPPFGVTRETGAWVWGGARNLGVLSPCLRLCYRAPGRAGSQPEEEKVGQCCLGRGLGRRPLVSFAYRYLGRLESAFSSASFQRDWRIRTGW